jgi:hypothetical protein
MPDACWADKVGFVVRRRRADGTPYLLELVEGSTYFFLSLEKAEFFVKYNGGEVVPARCRMEPLE